MSYSFDLTREPWIPCIGMNGPSCELGLRDVLVQAHTLREVDGETPLVTASLLRLMLALLHRIFGPATQAAWSDLWTAGRWDPTALDSYLARWGERLDLFHPKYPFLQAPDERVKLHSVTSMLHDFVGGNSVPLFNHESLSDTYYLKPGAAARFVVTSQMFGFAGTKGPYMQFTDGTCTRGISFFVQGDTLFETLALNLVRYPDTQVMPHTTDDRPAWEVDDPYVPERAEPLGYLDYLTWPNRRILLFPEHGAEGVIVREMTMGPALRIDPSVLDPMKLHTLHDKRGWDSLRFTEERALWRDSAALFRLRRREAQENCKFRPPAVLDWIWDLVYESDVFDPQDAARARRLMAFGMANYQARVEFYRAEQMPLIPDYLQDDALVEELQSILDRAELAAKCLKSAGRTLASLLLAPQQGSEGREPRSEDLDAMTGPWALERDYWSGLELAFGQTLVALRDDPDAAQRAWANETRLAAWRAFNRVTDSLADDARHLKAIVRATSQLQFGLSKVLPQEEEPIA